MKTLATILLCLLPWGVMAQYELPCTTSTVLPYIHTVGDDSIFVGGPGATICLTRADVQRMIDSALVAVLKRAVYIADSIKAERKP